MIKNKKISVIGAGSWGSALALLLAEKGLTVSLWAHRTGHIESLQKTRENVKYLPGIRFPDTLIPDGNLQHCIEGTDVIVMAVPSHSYRDVFVQIIPYLSPGCCVVSAVKGIENLSLMTMTQIMEELLFKAKRGDIRCGVLSGPSFAEEVARKVPTAVTVGFQDIEIAKKIQDLFVTDYFRVYASRDVIGLEISASLKNIIAIAAGVCDGLEYGLNTRAALITRGLAEMNRLGNALGADSKTFSGLSGLGDLILTCTGNLSRNRMVGLKLGEGKSLDQVKNEMNMVAEGIKTTHSIFHLAKKLGIEMPILEQIYNIIYRGKDCSLAVKDLLQRELKIE